MMLIVGQILSHIPIPIQIKVIGKADYHPAI
jgi:hypothetical protein